MAVIWKKKPIQNIKEGDIYTHEYNAPDIKEKSLNNPIQMFISSSTPMFTVNCGGKN